MGERDEDRDREKDRKIENLLVFDSVCCIMAVVGWETKIQRDRYKDRQCERETEELCETNRDKDREKERKIVKDSCWQCKLYMAVVG